MFRKAVAALVAVSALVFPAAAFAHVIVSPGEVAAGSRVTFELRVPTEEPVPTTHVRLLIPEGVVVSGVEPVYGWKIKLEREGGRVVAISAKGSLPPDFFQRFFFRATVPDQETTLVWKAIQTYKSGKVVRWTGEPGAEEASETVVGPASAGAGH